MGGRGGRPNLLRRALNLYESAIQIEPRRTSFIASWHVLHLSWNNPGAGQRVLGDRHDHRELWKKTTTSVEADSNSLLSFLVFSVLQMFSCHRVHRTRFPRFS